jgi:hypothetical protein
MAALTGRHRHPLFRSILVAGLALATTTCVNRNLRGWMEASPDGKTYLAIENDYSSDCQPIRLDGKPWLHRLSEKAAVEPGVHRIDACGEIRFEIPKGTVFHFDYWGP